MRRSRKNKKSYLDSFPRHTSAVSVMFQALVFLLFLGEGNAILWAKLDPNKKSYKKYQLWQAEIQNVSLSSEFEKLIEEKDFPNPNAISNIPSEDVWQRCDNNIDFLLNGNETEYWNTFLNSQNISYEVLLEDVQKAIEKEDLMKKYGDWRRGGNINWTSHPKLAEIYKYLKSIAAADSYSCTFQSIGKTAHRKDIMMLKLSNGNASNEAFLVEAGLHGREWVAISTVLYFIEHIAWNFTKQPDYIKNKDWYIIPVANRDGYEYTMNKDRLWRKNRRPFSGPCDGVDLNRNFDIPSRNTRFRTHPVQMLFCFTTNWGTRDSSRDICAGTFCGPTPFSEQETIAIRNVVNSRHFTGYVSVHSYGSAVLFPWVFDGRPSFHAEVHTRVAKEMVMAMRPVANEHFKAGTVSMLHKRKCSGSAMDWAHTAGVPHTYAIETRGVGFTLEANQLLPSVREVLAGLKKMAEIIV